MKPRSIIILVIIAAAAFTAGYLIRKPVSPCAHPPGDAATAHASHVKDENVMWICPMLCRPPSPRPGKCPVCGMDLVPDTSGTATAAARPRELRMSEAARKLASVQVLPVTRQYVDKQVRMVGRVGYDETRVGYVTAWMPGRLDKLFLNYTGATVTRGEHMAEIYSPELIAAQQELLAAVTAAEQQEKINVPSVRDRSRTMVESAREKLRLLGMSDDTIEQIVERGELSRHITLTSPMSGAVIEKLVNEGQYVETGTRLYTVADLSQVWGLLDAYERDLNWLRYGQEVTFTTQAYPGEKFTGRISFISPVLDPVRRTAQVRVTLPNPDGRLKPGFFARGTVKAGLADDGQIMAPDLAGKWISPMHPEIVKDEPGTCDVCGIDLVTAESLGYGAQDAAPPIVVPASAPLITGTRAVVYVQTEATDNEIGYEGREVVLGPRAGDFYVVREGLHEGELVVVNGAFKIDSALQLQGKPSMMNPEGGPAPRDLHDHGEPGERAPDAHAEHAAQPQMFDAPHAFRSQIEALATAYFAIQQPLSKDDPEGARKAAAAFVDALQETDATLLAAEAQTEWTRHLHSMIHLAEHMAKADADITSMRNTFKPLSDAMIDVVRQFGTTGAQPILLFHCPMAFDDRGADWLQNKPGVENPFYGEQMYRCGVQKADLTPEADAPDDGADQEQDGLEGRHEH